MTLKPPDGGQDLGQVTGAQDVTRARLLRHRPVVASPRLPCLVIGVGRWASGCLDELERTLQEAAEGTYLRVVRLEGSEPLEPWAVASAESALTLLERATGDDVARGQLGLWIVGDLHEGAHAVAAGRAAVAALQSRLPQGFTMTLGTVFLLPAGDTDNGAHVYAALRELAASEAADLRRSCYLVMPVQRLRGGRTAPVAPETVAGLVSEFLRLHATTSLPAVLAQVPMPAGFRSFGLATLEFPARAVKAILAAQYAGRMLDEGYLQRRAGASASEARRFLEEEGWLPDVLFGRVTQTGAVLRAITIEPVAFERVPMRHWPERIASFHDFFVQKKVIAQATIVRRAAREIAGEALAALRHRADSLIRESPSPERPVAYLERLLDACREAVAEAVAAKDQAHRESPQLPPLHRALAEAIQHRPGTLAVLTRSALLALLVTLSAEVVTRLLSSALTMLLPSFPAYRLGIVALCGAAALAWGVLTLAAAWATILRRRADYVGAVEQVHRQVVELFARQQVIERLRDLEGHIEEEIDAARRLHAVIVLVARRLVQVQPPLLPAWRRSLAEVLVPPPAFAYAGGTFEPAAEAAKFFLACGGGWRVWVADSEHGPVTLERAAREFAEAGFTSVEQVGVRELLHREAYATQRQDILRALREAAGVAIALASPQQSGVATMVLLEREDPDLLAGVLDDAAVMPSADPGRMVCFRMVYGIPLETLPGLPYWRQRYDRHDDPAGLHRVADWTHLPHLGAGSSVNEGAST